MARTQYQFLLATPDAAALGDANRRVLERLRGLPQVADVASDLQDRGLQAYVEIDRAAASRLGVSVAGIDNTLYNSFGQRLISTMFTQSNQYRVVLEVAPRYKVGLDALSSIFVPAAGGNQVPLASVARLVERPALLAVNHVGQFPSATISFNAAPGHSLGDAVKAIRAEIAALDLPAQPGDQLPGRGPGVPGLAVQHALADPGGRGHHVHRARRAVRELHPPAHDPVDLAVGGARCAAGADGRAAWTST